MLHEAQDPYSRHISFIAAASFFHEFPELMVLKEMPLLIIGLRLNDFLFVHETHDTLV